MKEHGFHDGWFEGLWLDGKSAHIFLATQKHERHVIVAHGVAALKADDVREGNIILDVLERPAEELSASDFDEFSYDGSSEEQQARQSKDLLEKGRAGSLALLEISPSYGATCTVLAKSFELINREDWLARYVLRPDTAPTSTQQRL